ncbi:alanyl-tRNA editing protein [Halohasta litorea]|uniref:Alanyl-tRNA editing protein n=1 Tax=Halohasta litorea TaxID=869891 RepID=A0ABD6D4K7_9EURY|nr:alanine--tRNA ligase-related protein [Halohasta litorea]
MSREQSGTRASADPYVTAFDSTVRSTDGREIVLDETYFYPEGGGQPADRGTLGGMDVVDVQKRDGEIVHTLATEPELTPSERVHGAIDESFRTYCMRAHTASHVVYGAGRRLFDAQGYGGFAIADDRIRLDFKTTASVDEIDPFEIERLATEAVWDGRSVEWDEMDADKARADDRIVFNLPDGAESADTVRIVEIDGWDISACGGTHVENTSEIGPITVLDTENIGEDLIRVEYAVGPTAIDQQLAERRHATQAAELLDTGVEELAGRAERLLERIQALEAERDEMRDRLLETRVAALSQQTVTKDGAEWLVGTVEAAGPNAVADRIRERENPADVVVLTGVDGATFLVVGTGGEHDANEIITDVTDEFGGGGGGQPTIAQGGGLDATPERVAEYVRNL